jgi:hypothetical protein
MKKKQRWGAISGARAGAAVVLALGFVAAAWNYRKAVAAFPDVPVSLHVLDAALAVAIYFSFVWGVPFAVWKCISWLLCRLNVSEHVQKRMGLFLVVGWMSALQADQRFADRPLPYQWAVAIGTWGGTFVLSTALYGILKGIRWLLGRRRS